jgi:hypothetical protein
MNTILTSAYKGDIVSRLRNWRRLHLAHSGILFEEAADEIARLRLTESEREAVRFCVTASLPETEKLGGVAGELCRMHSARLRGLLERLGTTDSE